MPLQLVAHRGLPFQFPENSFIGFERALQQGASWLETDVRLTADDVPILFHDPTAERLSGLTQPVSQLPLAELQRYGVFHPARFAARFRGNPVTTLRQFCHLLRRYPATRALIELKQERDTESSASTLISRVLSVIDDSAVSDRMTVISFHARLLAAVRRMAEIPIGLVCSGWTDAQQRNSPRCKQIICFSNIRSACHWLLSNMPAVGAWACLR